MNLYFCHAQRPSIVRSQIIFFFNHFAGIAQYLAECGFRATGMFAQFIQDFLFLNGYNTCFQLLHILADVCHGLTQFAGNGAKELSFLRKKGVLIVSSGNIIHNLRYMAYMNEKPLDWALEFDAKSTELINKGDHASLINYKSLGSSAEISVSVRPTRR